jgi:methionine synthase I (cobalamin-dependent)
MKAIARFLALLAALLIVAPLSAAGEKKAPKKFVPSALRVPAEITLSAEQQKKYDDLLAEYGPKAQALQKQSSEILTPEQRKAGEQARKAATAAGKKGKELQSAVDEAQKLTAEQRDKTASVRKETQALDKEMRAKLAEILTDAQKKQIEELRKKPVKKEVKK